MQGPLKKCSYLRVPNLESQTLGSDPLSFSDLLCDQRPNNEKEQSLEYEFPDGSSVASLSW